MFPNSNKQRMSRITSRTENKTILVLSNFKSGTIAPIVNTAEE